MFIKLNLHFYKTEDVKITKLEDFWTILFIFFFQNKVFKNNYIYGAVVTCLLKG